MRYIRYAILASIAVGLIVIAMANRGVVTVKALPTELAQIAGLNLTYDVPLFVVIFAGILGGLVLGFVWEWIREARERAEAARTRREMERMKAEIKRLKAKGSEPQDEVLALLDKAS
ncbi:MAG: lipopolysaccharide assembly protein LapA domain-containing protein [Pseudomonadota bacterium]